MPEEQNSEPENSVPEAPEPSAFMYPDSVWDEFVGQHVCVQLKAPYVAVTSPGTPIRTANPDGSQTLLHFQMVGGIFNVKKDARGELRVTLTMGDPDPDKPKAYVHSSFSPDLIDVISITSLPSQIVL